ncbi:helicase, partial [Gardnerella vaginalis]
LENVEFTKLDERLQALHDDRASLDTLPGRCVIERDLRGVGLEDLVCDLRRRNVTGSALDGELHLAWWTTVFEDIVNSSAIISNQDGSAMQDASDRFVQVDTEHVRSVGPMVQQETLKRLCELLFSRSQEANQLHTTLASNSSGVTFNKLMNSHADLLLAAKPIMVAMPSTLTMMTEFKPIVDIVILDSVEHLSNIELLSILARARQVVVIAHKNTVSSQSVNDLISVLPSVHVKSRATRRSLRLANFLENHGYGSLRHDVPVDRMQGKVKLHQVEASGVPVMSTGLIESSQREIDEVVSLIKQRATTFTVVPSIYVLAVVTLTSVFRNRLGAELKALAIKDENMNRFLRHVRLVDASESVGAAATDVILSLCYAKTSHGRLLQQFGVLEEEGGKGILLDSLALARRNLDIVCAFKSSDMEDERLHQDGPKLLKELLIWAEQLDDSPVNPTDFDEAKSEYDQDKAEDKEEAAGARAEAFDSSVDSFNNVLFTDLADRIRARGLCVAVNYGFDKEHSIPLVVGLPDKPFALAVLTDDMRFMNIESTRERHRMFAQDLEYLGWSVMNVWSVGAFVNPEKEVERVVSRIGELYGEDQ